MTERVPEDRVIRYWLARERGKRGDDPDVEGLSAREVADAILSEKPGAASFVWRETPVAWYGLDLDRDAFGALRPVRGPEDLLWRDLSTDGTLVGVAERIRAVGADDLADRTAVDLEAVLAYRDAVAAGERLDPPVVRTRRGHTPWYVADGNHRVTGAALHYLETGEFRPWPAYLAVTGNPVARPVVARIRGAIGRLAGRGIGRDARGRLP